MDGQAFCVLTASLMARNSPYATYAYRACADAWCDCLVRLRCGLINPRSARRCSVLMMDGSPDLRSPSYHTASRSPVRPARKLTCDERLEAADAEDRSSPRWA